MLGESRIGALIQLTTAAKFLSLRSPLAISVLGDSPSVEIQASKVRANGRIKIRTK
jgi:hypothetical protein